MPMPMKSRYDSDSYNNLSNNDNNNIHNNDTASLQSSLQDEWNEEDEREMQATVEELYDYLGYEKEDATCSEITERTGNTGGFGGGGGGGRIGGGGNKRRPSSSLLGSTIKEGSLEGGCNSVRRPSRSRKRSSSKTIKKDPPASRSSSSKTNTNSNRTSRSQSTERRNNKHSSPSRAASTTIVRSCSLSAPAPPPNMNSTKSRSSSVTRSTTIPDYRGNSLRRESSPGYPRNSLASTTNSKYHPNKIRYQQLHPNQQEQPQQQQIRVLRTISRSQTTTPRTSASSTPESASMMASTIAAETAGQGHHLRRSTQHPSQSQWQQQSNRYSISELVATLSHQKDTSELSPELERRVLDFRLAQQKRLEKYGVQNRYGIFGLYAHLGHVRVDLEWSEDAAWRRTHGRPYLSWSDFDAIQSKNPVRPWFTYFVVFLCSVMLLVEFGLNGWKVEPMSVNPLIGPSAEALIDAGARDTTLIIEQGQWFRIFSPLFLHAGIIHYVINMAALWFIGGAVEQSHGILNAMVLFFVPGVGGNILSAIFLPQYISVGASGGIFGLIGGCIADITLNWKLLFLSDGDGGSSPNSHNDNASNAERASSAYCSAWSSMSTTRRNNIMAIFWLVLEIVVNLVIGLTPYVDNFCHLGGLVYGVCCGWSTIQRLAVSFFGVSSTNLEKLQKLAMRYLGLILTMVLIIVTTVILATMNVGDQPCSNCRYVSCVPFPFWTEQKWWYCDDCDFVTATLYKNPDGDEIYDLIELTCPDGEIQSIPINVKNHTVGNITGILGTNTSSGTGDEYGREEIRQQLPGYCRQYCSTTKT